MKKRFPSTIVLLSFNEKKHSRQQWLYRIQLHEKKTQRKLCKINGFVCTHHLFFRLNKRTETNSVLLAENVGKNEKRKNNDYKNK